MAIAFSNAVALYHLLFYLTVSMKRSMNSPVRPQRNIYDTRRTDIDIV